jgi:hypothetical protein
MTPNSPLDKSPLVNHKLHIILSVISFGGWTPLYAVYYLFRKLTSSTVDQRRSKRAFTREKRRSKRASAKEGRRITRKLIQESSSKGYKYQPVTGIKKKSFLVSEARTYSLSCNHQIRAKNIKLIGKTVWCDVCNDHREVTGAIWAQY